MENNYFLMSIQWDKKNEPSIEDISQYFKIDVKYFDKDFGIVKVDDDTNTFAIRIEENMWYSLNNTDKKSNGPFSDVRIEPFDLDI